MTKNLFALLAVVAAPAYAELVFPTPEDPTSRALVERYRKDLPMLTSPDLLKAPAAAPQWPCEIDHKLLYQISGLVMADPEMKAEMDKKSRKFMREAGITAPAVEQNYSNIKIVPLVAHCEGDKLDGELQLLVSYTLDSVTKMTTMMGEKAVNMITTMHSDNANRMFLTMKAGAPQQDQMTVFDAVATNTMTADDPQMASALAKNKQPPVHTRIVTYRLASGHSATFNEVPTVKVSSGFLVPSVKASTALSATFTVPVGENRTRTLSYSNGRLQTSSQTKDGKQHGESIMYMDNVYKALGQKLDRQPGMENARAVTINGEDLIETRTCFQNGVIVKTAECSNE